MSGGVVDRTVAILETLSALDGPRRLSDLAQDLGIPKSAAHRILSALIARGWVEQSDETECYGLTLQMALLGQRQLARLGAENLRQPILDRLAARTRELVRLTAVQGDRLVWAGSARGRRSGLVYEPDMSERILPFATANGKCWLASLDPDRAVRLALDAGLGSERPTPNTLATVPALLAELERTRARGWGLADEEAEAGVAAVAVPVRRDGAVVATMSVAAPIVRMGPARVEHLAELLENAAGQMAVAWDADPEPPSRA